MAKKRDKGADDGLVVLKGGGGNGMLPTRWEDLSMFGFTGVLQVDRKLNKGRSTGRIYIHLGYPLGAVYEFRRKGKRTIQGSRAVVYILESAKHPDAEMRLIGQVDALARVGSEPGIAITDALSIGRFKWSVEDLSLERARERERADREMHAWKGAGAVPRAERRTPPMEGEHIPDLVEMMRLVASEWASAGYRVDALLRMLSAPERDLRALRRAFASCREKIRGLKRYESMLLQIDVDEPDLLAEVHDLLERMRDPDSLEETARRVDALLETIRMRREEKEDSEVVRFRFHIAAEERVRMRAAKLEELYNVIIARLGGAPSGGDMGLVLIPENRDAYTLCRSGREAVLMVIGPSGFGKNLLLEVARGSAIQRGESVVDLMGGSGDVPPADLYLLDGLERVAGDPDAEREVREVVDAVSSKGGGRLIITSSRHVETLRFSDEGTVASLGCAHAVELRRPGFDSRMELLRKRAAFHAHRVPEGVLAYLARVRRESPRSVMLALDKLLAMSLLLGHRVDLEFAREVIPEP